jgi:hypothetical protein
MRVSLSLLFNLCFLFFECQDVNRKFLINTNNDISFSYKLIKVFPKTDDNARLLNEWENINIDVNTLFYSIPLIDFFKYIT